MTESAAEPFAVLIAARMTYLPAGTPAGAATLTSHSSIASAPSIDGAREFTVRQPFGSVISCSVAIESLVVLRTVNGVVTTPPGATETPSVRELRTATGACANAVLATRANTSEIRAEKRGVLDTD